MKTVFVIYSPFQAICVYEAIAKYKIESPDIFCLGGYYLQKNGKTPLLLKELGLSFQVLELSSYHNLFVELLKKRNKNQYERCFIGDFFDPNLRLFASLSLTHNGSLYFLDDGASTLTAINTKRPLSIPSLRVKVKYIIPQMLSLLKRHNKKFFSIFDTEGGDKNELIAIRNRYSHNQQQGKGVFIIGTTYKGFKNSKTFFSLLEKTINCYKDPQQEIFYSPHRAAVDDVTIKDICSKYGVHYIVGDYCVEVDYIKNNYNPSIIVGFGSTALFTLRKIFPDSSIYSVKYPRAMINGDEEIYEVVNRDLQKNGVKVTTIIE